MLDNLLIMDSCFIIKYSAITFMKKIFFTLYCCFIGFTTIAQCDRCGENTVFTADFCYTNPLFPNNCAQFAFDQAQFYLNRNEVQSMITLGASDMNYFLDLAKDSSLQLTAEDMIFVMEANQAWMKRKTQMVLERGKDIPLETEGYKLQISGLGMKMMHRTSGEQAQAGRRVEVHYRGLLRDGTEFDNSFKRGRPISFPLGYGQVIKAWDEAIAKLKVGEAAWIEVPPNLGYGDRATGPIPANATLYFYVVLVGIK